MAVAHSVLNNYQLVNNTANSQRDGTLESSVEAVPQITIDQAEYNIQRVAGKAYPPGNYRNPRFYIPSLPANARKWFAVDATIGSGSNATDQLLVFVRQKPGAWKLYSAPSTMTVGRQLPIAMNPAGTATAVASDEPGLAIAPSQLPALHAGLLDGRPVSPGFANGRWTSAEIQGIESFKAAYGRSGWSYHDTWAATGYPSYSLRTADGGALVWYFLKDRQTWVRISGQPLQPGLVVRALAGKTQVTHRLTISSISEFVAIIPPAGGGQISIEADFTGNVAATAS